MRSTGIFQNLDWVLTGLYLFLAVLGLALVYSTTHTAVDESLTLFETSYGKQFMWFLISIILGVFIIVIDYKFYTSFAYIIFGGIMLLLASVLVLGVEINGSKSWFAFGSFRFQPAELAKFATCLALAKTITLPNTNLRNLAGKLKVLIILGIPMFLILLQGDVGSAVVFSSLIFVMHREGLESTYLVIGFGTIILSLLALLYPPFVLMYFYGLIFSLILFYNKKAKQPILGMLAIVVVAITYILVFNKYFYSSNPLNLLGAAINSHLFLLLPMLLFVLLGLVLYLKKKKWAVLALVLFLFIGTYTFSVNYIFNNVLKQHHRDRINLILGKIEDHSGAGYNLFQSKVAIGSGGFFGKGYLQGTQTALNFVPEQSTDFIFTSAAEQFGFIGSFIVVAVFVALLLRIIQVSERQRSTFARVYGYGVASILFLHFAVNIGMTIGLVPVIGIPLPFVSYGGSSLLSFTILLFVLIKFDTERLSVLR